MSQPQPTEARVRTISMLVIAFIMVAAALYWLRPVMIPLILAVLLTFVLSPLVNLLIRRLRVPRILAIALALVIGGMLISLLSGLVSSSLQQLSANADAYEQRIADLYALGVEQLSTLGIEIDLETAAEGLPIKSYIGGAANALVSVISNMVLILIFAVFMLQGTAISSLGGADGGLRSEISGRIQRYLVVKVVLSGVTGIIVGGTLAALGVDLALVFGVLTFVLNFIPSVGSIIATLLPIPIVLLDPSSTSTTLILAIVLPGTVQMLIGNVLEPKVMGEQLELHPITILAALAFWGALWGIPGMLLATPLTAALRILLDSLELTRPVARFMAGQLD